MRSLKLSLIVLGSVGLFFLAACSSGGNQAANTQNTPATSTSNAESSASPAAAKTDDHHGESHGGQVVETGAYHLEFVPEKEAQGTHMDFYLLRGENHQAIPNAKVTAQVQLPDGTLKPFNLKYDTEGKHYTALLPGNAAGQYQVKVTADVSGKKVDGRFNFNR